MITIIDVDIVTTTVCCFDYHYYHHYCYHYYQYHHHCYYYYHCYHYYYIIKCHYCCRPEKEAHQLAVRQKVRQAIMAGRVTDAQELLHQCNPDMLESVTHPNLDVLIFFHCLHYIELIR